MEIFKNDGYELAELIDVIAGSLKKTIARLDDLSIYFDASFSWSNNGLQVETSRGVETFQYEPFVPSFEEDGLIEKYISNYYKENQNAQALKVEKFSDF